MKRVRCLLACLAVSLLFVLTGCGSSVQVTDDENRMIAEYAANLLLKYDRNYQMSMATDEDASEEVTTEEATDTEEVTTEATTTEATTEVTTEASTQDDEAATQTEQTTEEESELPPSDAGNIADIAEIAGVSGVSITYNRVMFLDRYPSIDQDGAFIYLESDPGYKLAVVKFDISNGGTENVNLDLLNTDIEYVLTMNGSKKAKPMLTILMDDLGTYQGTIPADGTQDAVLVFQISENLIDSIQSLDLQASCGGRTGKIKIQ